MSRISFDRNKCMQCLRCISVCPFTVIHEKDGRPEVAPDKACILCAHCAAACPADAVLLDGTSAVLAEALPALPADFSQNLGDFLRTRRSYRHFKPVPVEEETLQEALHAAAWAPSAKNEHPARWYVVHREETINEIMGHILSYVKETGVNPEIVIE